MGRDFWHPYGDYDALANYRGAVTMGHLDTAPHEGAWGKLVSDIPGLGSDLGGSLARCCRGRNSLSGCTFGFGTVLEAAAKSCGVAKGKDPKVEPSLLPRTR